MSTLVLTPATAGPGGHWRARARNGFFRPIVELFNGIRQALAMAHRYDVLSHLSDAELAARRIKREDIPRLVVNGSYDL